MSVPTPTASSDTRHPSPHSVPDATPRWTGIEPSLARSALAVAATVVLVIAAASWGLWLDEPPEGLRPVLQFVVLALGAAALRWLWRLTRHARDATGSLLRFAQHVARDDGASVIDTRRGDSSTPGMSMLDDMAQGVEHALSERERRWKARARLSADWYWETGRDLRFSWVSDDLKSHVKLGLQPEDLLGRRHDEVEHYAPPEGGWNELNERMARRRSFREVQIEVRRPGRSSVWIAMSAKARRDAEGRFIGYEGVGRDITEQHLAFKRLRESERRYAVIADLSADWYWETDDQHRMTVLGPLAQDLLGEVATQAIGRRRWELNPEGATADGWARHQADMDARRPFRGFEYLMQRGERGPLWVSVSGLPRFDARGIFVGYHGVGRDITLRKRAERVLLTRNAQLERLVAERTAELEQSNRELEAFSRQLAHELRTPIGHVLAFAELLQLRGERLSDDERSWIAMQAQAARAMQDTVTALLELAHSSAMTLEREAVDLSALALSLIGELPTIERRAAVEWHVEPGLAAHCSAPLVRVVLMNLLSNAAKFTRDVSAPCVALRRIDTVAGVPVFAVEDNGAGFDAARAARLFQPFVRLHSIQQYPGTGVGLSIVRRVVERHGGFIRAGATPGVGARFEFTLAPAAAPNAGETTDDAAVPAA